MPVSGLLPVPAPPIAAFVDALSEANAGRGRVAAGLARGGRRAAHGRARRAACRRPEADCRPRAPQRGERAGCAGRRSIATRRRASTRRSATSSRIGDDDVELRVYFHLTAAGAAPLVASCTAVLNDAGVPFVLKVVDNPAAFVALRRRRAVPRAGDFAARRSAPGRRRLRASPAGGGAGVRQAARRRRGRRRAPPRRSARASARAAAGSSPRGSSTPTSGGARLDARLDAVERRFAASGLDLRGPVSRAGLRGRYVL